MEKWGCPHCGEELLGAANRCWKCGKRVQQPLPAPVEVQLAEVAGGSAPLLMTIDEAAVATRKEPPRRGSPFAVENALSGPSHGTFYGSGPYSAPQPQSSDRPALQPNYPRNVEAVGGVTAALVLGGFSLIVTYFSIFGGVIALLGIACAVWGLFSRKKGLAIFALILCCLALTLAAWRTGFMLYERIFPGNTAATGAPPVL